MTNTTALLLTAEATGHHQQLSADESTIAPGTVQARAETFS